MHKSGMCVVKVLLLCMKFPKQFRCENRKCFFLDTRKKAFEVIHRSRKFFASEIPPQRILLFLGLSPLHSHILV